MQFTSESSNRGKVIFIAATNRPDLIDAALKRAGRFDKKIPILLPECGPRTEIFKVIIKKYNFATESIDFAPFAEKTEGYTGAEIEAAVRKAYEIACKKGDGVITWKSLEEAVMKCRPNTQQIQLMTELALNECEDEDLLPERYKRRGDADENC